MLSLDDITAQHGLAPATSAILHALDAGAELAHVVAEQADHPNLTGPARALSIRAHNDVEAGVVSRHHAAGDIVWVSPADILARRNVPRPPPVAEALRRTSASVIEAATTVAGAALASMQSTPTNTHRRSPATREVGDQTPNCDHAELRHGGPPANPAGHATAPGR